MKTNKWQTLIIKVRLMTNKHTTSNCFSSRWESHKYTKFKTAKQMPSFNVSISIFQTKEHRPLIKFAIKRCLIALVRVLFISNLKVIIMSDDTWQTFETWHGEELSLHLNHRQHDLIAHSSGESYLSNFYFGFQNST